MPQLSRLVRAAAALLLAAGLAAPAQAQQWGVGDNLAGVETGEHLLVFICDGRSRAFRLITPQRVPTVGSNPYKRFHTTYSVDGGAKREATLFLRGQDLSKPQYVYTLVLETRGMQTRLDDVIHILSRGRELRLELLAEEVAIPLARADRAIEQVDRNCR